MRNKEQIISNLQRLATELSKQADMHQMQSKVFEAQGFKKLADKYAGHSTEEREYVSQFITRILDLGGEVKLEARDAGQIYKDPVEFLKFDYEVSKAGIPALVDIIEDAREEYTTFDILKEYYKDEEEDMNWSESQLELIETIGKAFWLMQQL